MTEAINWLEKLLYEYIKEMGIKDKLHLIQKLLKEIEKDVSMSTASTEAKTPC